MGGIVSPRGEASGPLMVIQNQLRQIQQFKQVNQNIYNTALLANVNMTYQRINLNIQQNIQQQKKHTDEVKKTEKAAAGFLEKTKALLGACIDMGAVSGFLKLSDDMTQAGRKLNWINDGTRKNSELQNMIYQAAVRSRGSYAEMLDLVSRLNLSAKDIFTTNEEATAFTEQMNKHFKIGGASLQNQQTAIQQLTQAIASGVLQGNEFQSIMENAPMLVQALAKHLGVSEGELKKLSMEGRITADVIKNAVLASAMETDAAFAELPLTLGDVANQISNDFIQSLQPALSAFHELVNTQSFQNFVLRISEGSAIAADWLGKLVGGISEIIHWLDTSWAIAGPIIGGVALALTTVTVAQLALNAAMAVNPIFLIIIAIGGLLGYLWSLAESIGGIEVVFLMFQMTVGAVWDSIRIATLQGVYQVQEVLAKFELGFFLLKNGVLNGVGAFRVEFLTLLQNMVNAGIDILNGFFSVLNKVPGVSIAMLEHVSMGAAAAAEEEALWQARKQEEQQAAVNFIKKQKENVESIAKMKEEAASLMNQRQAEIVAKQEAARAEKAEKQNEEDKGFLKLYEEAKKTNASLKKGEAQDTSGKGTKVENEDLSYLKTVFWRRNLSQIHLDKVIVQVDNSFGDIHETADLNGWVNGLTDGIRVAMHRIAEG